MSALWLISVALAFLLGAAVFAAGFRMGAVIQWRQAGNEGTPFSPVEHTPPGQEDTA